MTTPSHTAARERLNEAFNLYGPDGRASVDCADLRLLLDRLDALEGGAAPAAYSNTQPDPDWAGGEPTHHFSHNPPNAGGAHGLGSVEKARSKLLIAVGGGREALKDALHAFKIWSEHGSGARSSLAIANAVPAVRDAIADMEKAADDYRLALAATANTGERG